MPTVLLVALGSALGGAARYGVSLWLNAGFPWGTLAVNVLGSAMIGWCSASLTSSPARLFLMTGVCGGFTTFSAFSLEALALMRQGDPLRAAGYMFASLLLCGAAVAGGALLGRGR